MPVKRKFSMCRRLQVEYSKPDRKWKNRVMINISGEIFETYYETLKKFPGTLLADDEQLSKYICPSTNQYFFQRNRICFESILYFYQSNGTLNCPMGVQIDLFEKECSFFKIPKIFIDKMKRREGIFPDLIDNPEEKERKESGEGSFRLRVWNVLENPNTSFVAWTFGVISVTAVVLSIFTATFETMHVFEKNSQVWSRFELAINLWFLLELILRMSFSRKLIDFVKGYMNIFDVVAVLPYFLILLVQSDSPGKLIDVLKTLKFLRICRLFRFSKEQSRRLAVVGKIVYTCLSSFRLLLICLTIIIFFGGAVMYILEENHVEDDDFRSLPASLWWCVQTVTTVGYGDLIPRTVYGRVFACGLMLLGVATTSLPILTIVSQFVRLYPKNIKIVASAGQGMVGGKLDDGIQFFNKKSIKMA